MQWKQNKSCAINKKQTQTSHHFPREMWIGGELTLAASLDLDPNMPFKNTACRVSRCEPGFYLCTRTQLFIPPRGNLRGKPARENKIDNSLKLRGKSRAEALTGNAKKRICAKNKRLVFTCQLVRRETRTVNIHPRRHCGTLGTFSSVTGPRETLT